MSPSVGMVRGVPACNVENRLVVHPDPHCMKEHEILSEIAALSARMLHLDMFFDGFRMGTFVPEDVRETDDIPGKRPVGELIWHDHPELIEMVNRKFNTYIENEYGFNPCFEVKFPYIFMAEAIEPEVVKNQLINEVLTTNGITRPVVVQPQTGVGVECLAVLLGMHVKKLLANAAERTHGDTEVWVDLQPGRQTTGASVVQHETRALMASQSLLQNTVYPLGMWAADGDEDERYDFNVYDKNGRKIGTTDEGTVKIYDESGNVKAIVGKCRRDKQGNIMFAKRTDSKKGKRKTKVAAKHLHRKQFDAEGRRHQQAEFETVKWDDETGPLKRGGKPRVFDEEGFEEVNRDRISKKRLEELEEGRQAQRYREEANESRTGFNEGSGGSRKPKPKYSQPKPPQPRPAPSGGSRPEPPTTAPSGQPPPVAEEGEEGGEEEEEDGIPSGDEEDEDESDQLPEEENGRPQPVTYSPGAAFWRTEDSNGNITYSTDTRWTKKGTGGFTQVQNIEGRKRRTLEKSGALSRGFVKEAFQEEENQFMLDIALLKGNPKAYEKALEDRWADLLTPAYYDYVVNQATAINNWENPTQAMRRAPNVPRPVVHTYHRVQKTARPSDFPQDRPAARRAPRADEAVEKDEEAEDKDEEVEEEEEPGVTPADNNPFALLDTSRTQTQTKTKGGKTTYKHVQTYSGTASKKVYTGKTQAPEAHSAVNLRNLIMRRAVEEGNKNSILLTRWVDSVLTRDQEKWTLEVNRLRNKGQNVAELEAERTLLLENPQYYERILRKAKEIRVDYTLHSSWYPFKCFEVWSGNRKKEDKLAVALWRALLEDFLGANNNEWLNFAKVAVSDTPKDHLEKWVQSENKSEKFKTAAMRCIDIANNDLAFQTDLTSFKEIFERSTGWAKIMSKLTTSDIGKWVIEEAGFELYQFDIDLEASGEGLSLENITTRVNYLLSLQYQTYITQEAEIAGEVFKPPAKAEAAPEQEGEKVDWDSLYYENLPDLEKSARRYAQARVKSERDREFNKDKKSDLRREIDAETRGVSTDTVLDIEWRKRLKEFDKKPPRPKELTPKQLDDWNAGRKPKDLKPEQEDKWYEIENFTERELKYIKEYRSEHEYTEQFPEFDEMGPDEIDRLAIKREKFQVESLEKSKTQEAQNYADSKVRDSEFAVKDKVQQTKTRLAGLESQRIAARKKYDLARKTRENLENSEAMQIKTFTEQYKSKHADGNTQKAAESYAKDQVQRELKNAKKTEAEKLKSLQQIEEEYTKAQTANERAETRFSEIRTTKEKALKEFNEIFPAALYYAKWGMYNECEERENPNLSNQLIGSFFITYFHNYIHADESKRTAFTSDCGYNAHAEEFALDMVKNTVRVVEAKLSKESVSRSGISQADIEGWRAQRAFSAAYKRAGVHVEPAKAYALASFDALSSSDDTTRAYTKRAHLAVWTYVLSAFNTYCSALEICNNAEAIQDAVTFADENMLLLRGTVFEPDNMTLRYKLCTERLTGRDSLFLTYVRQAVLLEFAKPKLDSAREVAADLFKLALGKLLRVTVTASDQLEFIGGIFKTVCTLHLDGLTDSEIEATQAGAASNLDKTPADIQLLAFDEKVSPLEWVHRHLEDILLQAGERKGRVRRHHRRGDEERAREAKKKLDADREVRFREFAKRVVTRYPPLRPKAYLSKTNQGKPAAKMGAKNPGGEPKKQGEFNFDGWFGGASIPSGPPRDVATLHELRSNYLKSCDFCGDDNVVLTLAENWALRVVDRIFGNVAYYRDFAGRIATTGFFLAKYTEVQRLASMTAVEMEEFLQRGLFPLIHMSRLELEKTANENKRTGVGKVEAQSIPHAQQKRNEQNAVADEIDSLRKKTLQFCTAFATQQEEFIQEMQPVFTQDKSNLVELFHTLSNECNYNPYRVKKVEKFSLKLLKMLIIGRQERFDMDDVKPIFLSIPALVPSNTSEEDELRAIIFICENTWKTKNMILSDTASTASAFLLRFADTLGFGKNKKTQARQVYEKKDLAELPDVTLVNIDSKDALEILLHNLGEERKNILKPSDGWTLVPTTYSRSKAATGNYSKQVSTELTKFFTKIDEDLTKAQKVVENGVVVAGRRAAARRAQEMSNGAQQQPGSKGNASAGDNIPDSWDDEEDMEQTTHSGEPATEESPHQEETASSEHDREMKEFAKKYANSRAEKEYQAARQKLEAWRESQDATDTLEQDVFSKMSKLEKDRSDHIAEYERAVIEKYDRGVAYAESATRLYLHGKRRDQHGNDKKSVFMEYLEIYMDYPEGEQREYDREVGESQAGEQPMESEDEEETVESENEEEPALSPQQGEPQQEEPMSPRSMRRAIAIQQAAREYATWRLVEERLVIERENKIFGGSASTHEMQKAVADAKLYVNEHAEESADLRQQYEGTYRLYFDDANASATEEMKTWLVQNKRSLEKLTDEAAQQTRRKAKERFIRQYVKDHEAEWLAHHNRSLYLPTPGAATTNARFTLSDRAPISREVTKRSTAVADKATKLGFHARRDNMLAANVANFCGAADQNGGLEGVDPSLVKLHGGEVPLFLSDERVGVRGWLMQNKLSKTKSDWYHIDLYDINPAWKLDHMTFECTPIQLAAELRLVYVEPLFNAKIIPRCICFRTRHPWSLMEPYITGKNGFLHNDYTWGGSLQCTPFRSTEGVERTMHPDMQADVHGTSYWHWMWHASVKVEQTVNKVWLPSEQWKTAYWTGHEYLQHRKTYIQYLQDLKASPYSRPGSTKKVSGLLTWNTHPTLGAPARNVISRRPLCPMGRRVSPLDRLGRVGLRGPYRRFRSRAFGFKRRRF